MKFTIFLLLGLLFVMIRYNFINNDVVFLLSLTGGILCVIKAVIDLKKIDKMADYSETIKK